MTVDRQAIYERDGGLCGFCGQPVPWEVLHLDHHPVPRALGGPTIPENLRVAHRKCNTSGGKEVRLERARLGLPPAGASHIKIPADLARRIRKLAARERRTIKGQIEVLLERGLAVTSTNDATTLGDESKEVAA